MTRFRKHTGLYPVQMLLIDLGDDESNGDQQAHQYPAKHEIDEIR